ncbi:piggyBac transposable element-derived protein 4-like [Lytechinus pictus]|uniref:piggyBac transposable element-derived protein 4-like n=1 Tax=Lytechinus pictus TaxID=7653 RepID=UPI0030B9F3DD
MQLRSNVSFLFSLFHHRRVQYKSYDDRDGNGPAKRELKFRSNRPSGAQLENVRTRQGAATMTTAQDYFKLFFTIEVIQQICDYTNKYANAHIANNSTYASSDGTWNPVTVDEMWSLIGLLIYMGLARFPDIESYWSTATLYHGSWSRSFMSRDRYKAIMSFLHVVDPDTEDPNDVLRKVRFLLDHMKQTCQALYQPHEHIAIDERMVRSKGRFSIRQYIRDKPTKWGFKLWVVADSKTGYTFDFDVYIGRREQASENGLSYDVVFSLCENLLHQGYKLYIDNFYTSMKLLTDLKRNQVWACGTANSNRRGFPVEFKTTIKDWSRNASRGNMRWVRSDGNLVQQWKDNKAISMISSFHDANDFEYCRRRVKERGQFHRKLVRQPMAVRDYNSYMGGVDRSDQLLSNYDILRKTVKYWKTLFFHFVDIAIINSFILFQDWRGKHANVEALHRPSRYDPRNFREELCRQLGGINDDDPVPLYRPVAPQAAAVPVPANDPEFFHLPEDSVDRLDCKVCAKTMKKNAYKSYVRCLRCDVHLCMNKKRNCYYTFHTDPSFKDSVK